MGRKLTPLIRVKDFAAGGGKASLSASMQKSASRVVLSA